MRAKQFHNLRPAIKPRRYCGRVALRLRGIRAISDQDDFRIGFYRTTGSRMNYGIVPPREIKLTTSVTF